MSLMLLLLLAMSARTSYGQEEPDNCPVPPQDQPCVTVFQPVTCTNREINDDEPCTYDNSCYAGNAGYDADNDCVNSPSPPSCPSPPDGTPCTANYLPLVCVNADLTFDVELSCEYDNECLAEESGYDVGRDCEDVPLPPSCPTPPDGTPCTTNFLPLTCIDEGLTGSPDLACDYDNECLAEESGFNVGRDCVPSPTTETMSPTFVVTSHSSCPVPAEDQPCTTEFAPIRCDLGEAGVGVFCEYGNGCQAEAAGFDIEADCEFAVFDETPSPTFDCPVPGEGIPCQDIYEPVSCGDVGCVYGNQCEADAAGYADGDCVEAAPTQTDVDVVTPCPAIYDPVECGGDADGDGDGSGGAAGVYDNLCLAEASGYLESQCVPYSEPVCPEPSPDVICIDLWAPVRCKTASADYECEYGNLCVAEAAGYSPYNDCYSTECPLPDQETNCILSFEPVGCSNSQYSLCTYDNECLAEAANFVVQDDCVEAALAGCPVPRETACPFIEAPVVCGGNECEYANLCIAEAADFTESDCIAVSPTCPPPGDFPCTKIYQPVTCLGGCTYDNLCIADAAGYDSSSCVLGLIGPDGARGAPTTFASDSSGGPTTATFFLSATLLFAAVLGGTLSL